MYFVVCNRLICKTDMTCNVRHVNHLVKVCDRISHLYVTEQIVVKRRMLSAGVSHDVRQEACHLCTQRYAGGSVIGVPSTVHEEVSFVYPALHRRKCPSCTQRYTGGSILSVPSTVKEEVSSVYPALCRRKFSHMHVLSCYCHLVGVTTSCRLITTPHTAV